MAVISTGVNRHFLRAAFWSAGSRSGGIAATFALTSFIGSRHESIRTTSRPNKSSKLLDELLNTRLYNVRLICSWRSAPSPLGPPKSSNLTIVRTHGPLSAATAKSFFAGWFCSVAVSGAKPGFLGNSPRSFRRFHLRVLQDQPLRFPRTTCRGLGFLRSHGHPPCRTSSPSRRD